MYKYLYGKRERLKDLLGGRQGIRFTDIAHLKNNEKGNSWDNEDLKKFGIPDDKGSKLVIESRETKIVIPGTKLKGLSLGQPPRRCHIRCLSNSGFSKDLYEYFDADICLELNIEVLLDILNESFLAKDGGLVVAKDVIYSDLYEGFVSIDRTKVVFTKPTKYQIEDEFRIALDLPP